MTRGVPALTIEQKKIIQENSLKFTEDIMKMPGMEGTTKRQIRDFMRRLKDSEEEYLVNELEEYIGVHGLPKEYAGVMRYIRYLKRRM